jgi:pyruvate dehydrogenase E2 component (dihydrolipoamide acetyltransferase)
MPFPLLVPRINNNDDSVRLTKVLIDLGAFMRQGDPIADIETDKAVFTIEAEQEGYLLTVTANAGDTVDVGSVLAWIGSSPDEPVPASSPQSSAPPESKGEISLKAAQLLAQFGLEAAEIPSEGNRLTAADVERYVKSRGLESARPAASTSAKITPPLLAPGRLVKLTPEQHGMLKTVEWQTQEAAPAYVEIAYDASAWEHYARDFEKSNRLLLSAVLPLLAWRLAQLARLNPDINVTLSDGKKYVYDHINVGFTVQAGKHLYLVVVHAAENLSQAEFVRKLADLQRAALKNSLHPEETSGATIGFSSMARWPVTRHVPILIPRTALMIAHTAPLSGAATLGATYDHRALSGGDVVEILQALARPEDI